MHVDDMIPSPWKLHEENQQLRRMVDNLKEDLRDQFAMAALAPTMAYLIEVSTEKIQASEETIAKMAYIVADAMLAAREGREG